MGIHPLMAGAAAGVIVLSGVGVAAITGVLPRSQAEKAVEQPVAKKECADCGVVVGVRLVEQKGEGTGLGTVVGAAGGAVAGHQIERHARTTKHYEVRVRMADGRLRTVKFASQPAWKSGDKVRLQDGKLMSA